MQDKFKIKDLKMDKHDDNAVNVLKNNDIENALLPQKWMGKKIISIYNTYGCDIHLPWQVSASQWGLENISNNK